MLRLVAALLICVSLRAVAVEPDTVFPARPMRLIVPFSPGGPTDVLARVVAAQLGHRLAQPVVVENKPGAHGVVGVQAAQGAPADGHTLLMVSIGTHGINPALYPQLPYDAARDFIPIGLVGKMPLVLYAGPALAAGSLREVVAQAKSRPGGLTYASSGSGGSSHLAGEMLRQRLGIDIRHVPYKGIAPAQSDVVAGHVDLLFDTLATGAAQARAGRLKAIAIASPVRASQLPGVPTFAEAGMNGFEITAWYGLVVMRGTSEPVIAKLQQALALTLSDPAMLDRLRDDGVLVDTKLNGSVFGEFMQAERLRWAQVVRSGGVKAE